MFPPLVSPVLSCLVLAVLSTRQTPAVLLRSRKRLVSSGAGYGPGPISVLPCYLIHCPQRVILTLWGNCPVFGFTIGRGTRKVRGGLRPPRRLPLAPHGGAVAPQRRKIRYRPEAKPRGDFGRPMRAAIPMLGEFLPLTARAFLRCPILRGKMGL